MLKTKTNSVFGAQSMRILATIDLTPFDVDGVDIGFLKFNTSSLKSFSKSVLELLKENKNYDAVLFTSSDILSMFAFFIFKICRPKMKIFVFDLILKCPRSCGERIIAFLKGKLLRSVDGFLMINKYWEGYKKYYGLQIEKCYYIPFKPNNYHIYREFKNLNRGYVLCCGASQRDIDTLIQAAAMTETSFKILLPTTLALIHNAKHTINDLPGNVEIINSYLDKKTWYRYMAECFCVAIPIIENTLQPAGISVYLEAMLFQKPVIITKGSSTIGLLDDDLAMIVPPKSPPAIAKALKSLKTDKALYDGLSRRGFNYAKQLQGHDRMMIDVLTVLIQIADSRSISSTKEP